MKQKFLILIILVICAGCASTPDKPAGDVKEIFYPPLPQRPRLQFLRSISGQKDLGKTQSAFREFIVGKSADQLLGKPYDVCATKGKIYILDRLRMIIVILNLVEKKMSFVNDRGEGSLEDPAGIFVSEEDFKYVADMQKKQIVAFDDKNNFFRTYGGPEMFEKPVDVAVDDKRVYVVDMKKELVFVLDKNTGRISHTVGRQGDLFKPTHVTVAPSGDIFITDAFHFLVKKFSSNGEFIDSIGFHGDQLGGFARPKGTAVDKDNRLYVVDAAFENVQIFDDQGRILLFFGGSGSTPGDLYLPVGIAIDYENIAYFQQYANPEFKLEYLIYVTSMFGKSPLNVYGFGHWFGEYLPGE